MIRAHRRALIAALALAAAPAARAQGFSTTNVQFLYGTGFKDPLYDAGGRPMQTTTINHFDAFGWGDSFFFVDLYRANFSAMGLPYGAPHKDDAQLYAEWHPRLFLSKLVPGAPKIPFVRNYGLAAEINQGSPDFYAYLGGVGFDFVAPKGWVLGLNVYYRYDRFAYNQWQVSPFWTVPFAIGPVPFLFTGFVDVNGTKSLARNNGVEVWAQPELLVDVLAPFGGPKGQLYVGTEWWYHRTPDKDSSVPQVMAQWTIF